MAFGKKAQVCGVMAGPRLDEVKDNAFRLSSRLNSTWGGNFTDMVRSTHFLRIIEEETSGGERRQEWAHTFLDRLRDLQDKDSRIPAARGRGLFLAFDLPDAKTREEFWKGFFYLGVSDASLGREFNPVSSSTRHHRGSDRRGDGCNAEILSETEMILVARRPPDAPTIDGRPGGPSVPFGLCNLS